MFCQDCGHKLVLKFCENEGLVPYCDECREFKFPPFKTAVSMVAVNKAQDKILIGKHTNGEYLLFAGYVKKGESAEKAIVREIKEETGQNAVKYKYMCSRYHEPKNVLMLGFIVVISDGDISVNQDEIEEVKWCSFDEAIETVKEDTTAGFFLKNAVAELKRNKI
ncbi:MAG TPA: NUDIX domain-containing protein [Candidatus Borkfalkia excrementavium]|uniref:NUDIX domain-containing protein n=1 Tax=Candidatus Borkfalkia excrementavium TaxID=2838505 RepID=A0A9D1Z967_9FIRM|nr:NUDIX domain-containing protein [Candidatus Borkfalkia excrementavium]